VGIQVRTRPPAPPSAGRAAGPRLEKPFRTLELAPNENIASILLKVERVAGQDVTIVAPAGMRVLRNPVSMRLLERKAEDLGIGVTVISEDDQARQLCLRSGFSCYATLDGAAHDDGRGPRRFDTPLPRFGQLTRVSAAAALCLLGLIVFVAYFVLPAASITISPVASDIAIDVAVTADPNVTSADGGSGKIPAHVVFGEAEGSSSVNATGQRDVPNQPARGTVTFTNLTNQAVTVPKSTVLLAGSTAFFTLQDTPLLPSISIGGTDVPGSGLASVQAADPGDKGNVPVGAITSVQGPLSSKVSVINRMALTGGSNKKAGYLSADDQGKAKQALLDQLRQAASARITEQIARNETFLPSPNTAGDGAIEELTYEESPEQVVSQTKLHMKVMLRGLTFQGDDVNQVVAERMDDAVRQRGAGAQLLDEPLAIQPPVVVSNDGGTVRLQVHAAGRMVSSLDARQLADRVRGQSETGAEATLRTVPGVGSADVQLWPVWARKVPSFSWRIHSTISSPAG
jgi:hypothetical protein